MTSLRQSPRSLHHACQHHPHHSRAAFSSTNSVEKVITTEQLHHPTANTFPTNESWTETWRTCKSWALKSKRQSLQVSVPPTTFLFSLKNIGSQCCFSSVLKGHTGCWATYRIYSILMSHGFYVCWKRAKLQIVNHRLDLCKNVSCLKPTLYLRSPSSLPSG